MSEKNSVTSSAALLKDASDLAEMLNGIFLAFVDAIGKPISNLIVKISAGGNTQELRTDQHGHLPVINFDSKVTGGVVTAIMPTGIEEEILKFRLSTGVESYTCQSPYLLLKGEADIHAGKPSEETKQTLKTPGETEKKRNKDGAPVVAAAVSMDCPNDDNLKLGDNVIYKEMILKASKHSGIIPQAVAALINSEAETLTTYKVLDVVENGKQKKDKHGKVVKAKGAIVKIQIWNKRSHNDNTDATGLTQFIPGTWKGMALDTSSNLHKEAVSVSKGYVKNEPVKKITHKAIKEKKDKHGKIIAPAKAEVSHMVDQYVIKEESKLLEMRNDPEISIMASVDYAKQNIAGLSAKFPKIKGLNDVDKAKFIYLAHHLGLGDAIRFINNEITDDDSRRVLKNKRTVRVNGAKRLLTPQFDNIDAVNKLVKNDGDSYMLAHRRWLIGYINLHIVIRTYACVGESLPADKSLFDLIVNIDGSHPDGFALKK